MVISFNRNGLRKKRKKFYLPTNEIYNSIIVGTFLLWECVLHAKYRDNDNYYNKLLIPQFIRYKNTSEKPTLPPKTFNLKFSHSRACSNV